MTHRTTNRETSPNGEGRSYARATSGVMSGNFPNMETETMTDTTVTLATVAATVGADITGFRKAAVAAENKATPFARSMLAALLSNVYTKALAESAIITAFGNPKSKAGKPIKALTGSGDHLVGWGAVRKSFADVATIFDNVEVPGVRPLVVAFILSDANAAKSLRALKAAVGEAIAEHAKSLIPEADVADAEADNDANDNAAPTVADAAPTVSLSDRVMALMVAYEAATSDEKNDAHSALEMLFDMVNAAIQTDADAAFDTVEDIAQAA